MKLIFLDVDGVLNSYRNIIAYGGFPFPDTGEPNCAGATSPHEEKNLDPIAIGMVRALKTPIVLSSTWRHHVDPIEFGKKYNLDIIGKTNNKNKPESIMEYRWAHLEISDYVIIDDDSMADDANQVFVDIRFGFTLDNFYEAASLLGIDIQHYY